MDGARYLLKMTVTMIVVIIFTTDKIENYIFSVTSKIIDGVELSEEQVAPIYNPCQDQNQLTQE